MSRRYRNDVEHFLSVMCMFKNESHIVKEWTEHYIREGVDHFYLIDNGSTDNYLKEIENNFSNISIIHDSGSGIQAFIYKIWLKSDLIRSKWLLIVDMDEFVYAKNGFNTIKDFLKQKCESYNQIVVPMAIFTSNNHIQQPPSVIQGFTERQLMAPTTTRNLKNLRYVERAKTKAIVRVNDFPEDSKRSALLNFRHFYTKHSIGVHGSYVPGITISSDLKRTMNMVLEETWIDKVDGSKVIATNILREASEEIFDDSYLLGNHYTVQSYDTFWSKLDRYRDHKSGAPKGGHSIHAYCGKSSCKYCADPEWYFQRQWDNTHGIVGYKSLTEDTRLPTKIYKDNV